MSIDYDNATKKQRLITIGYEHITKLVQGSGVCDSVSVGIKRQVRAKRVKRTIVILILMFALNTTLFLKGVGGWDYAHSSSSCLMYYY